MATSITSTHRASNTFVLKGDIIYSLDPQHLSCTPNGYLVCEDGLCTGVFTANQLPSRFASANQLPSRFATAGPALNTPLHDFTGHLIIPGLVDLHTHAPQFPNRGLGMDLELLEWLDTYTFPQEARYANLDYARPAYQAFVADLLHGATTRAAIFATIHVPATLLLMDLLEASGLSTFVGKVNMDRNCLDSLDEKTAHSSLDATQHWLRAVAQRGFKRTGPILTPRFVPTCSNALLTGLGQLQREWNVPVQSHLSENPAEITWVHQLCPDVTTYADAYLQAGLLGGPSCPTIMAHCVYSHPSETPLLKQRGVWIAHCPISNTCMSNGIAPARTYLEQDLHMGLGTDVSGGYSPSLFQVIAETIKVSKLRWRLVDQDLAPLTLAEAFYLATKGGGSFWEAASGVQVGSFEPGYSFDAVVLEDTAPTDDHANLVNRLERLVYADANNQVLSKYIDGQRLF